MDLTQTKIIVYGTPWCGDCRRTRAFLDKHQIVYDWIDIDRDPVARATVEKTNR
jgi:arsenate reductase-like glutaredoxin family protein